MKTSQAARSEVSSEKRECRVLRCALRRRAGERLSQRMEAGGPQMKTGQAARSEVSNERRSGPPLRLKEAGR